MVPRMSIFAKSSHVIHFAKMLIFGTIFISFLSSLLKNDVKIK
jgi:hypothetical protein